MKTGILATSFLVAALTLPLAAQAGTDCGVPQGYGTNNPNTFNRSTCGLGDNSYNVPNAAAAEQGVRETVGRPQDIGRNNPFIPNSGEPHLGSNTDGPSSYSYTIPSSVAGSGEETLSKPAGYGTNNDFIPNSGAPHLGSNTDGM